MSDTRFQISDIKLTMRVFLLKMYNYVRLLYTIIHVLSFRRRRNLVHRLDSSFHFITFRMTAEKVGNKV